MATSKELAVSQSTMIFTEKSIAIFTANCSSPWVSQGCKINNNKKLTILCSQNVSRKVCGTTVSSVETGPLMGILFSWIHRPSDLISGMSSVAVFKAVTEHMANDFEVVRSPSCRWSKLQSSRLYSFTKQCITRLTSTSGSTNPTKVAHALQAWKNLAHEETPTMMLMFCLSSWFLLSPP